MTVLHPDPPAWLAGAWIRTNRSIALDPPLECSDVIWLQVGPWFADLRLPRPGQVAHHAFDEAHAFSGWLEVVIDQGDGAQVAWHHDLDTTPHVAGQEPDAAGVEVRAGVLVEAGDGYVEWWEPPATVPDGSAAMVLSRSGDDPVQARLVCVAGMAVCVWGGMAPGGGAWSCAELDWEPARVVGMLPPELGMAAALRAALGGTPPPAPWIIEEVHL